MLKLSYSTDIYTKRGVIAQSDSISSEDLKSPIPDNEGSITTIYDYKQLSSKLNKFFQMAETTEEQINIIISISERLSCLDNPPDITISEGPEEEAVVSFQSEHGIHLVAISTDGDSMVSFSGFKFQDGWRKFYTYEEMDSEKLTYNFLTSIRDQHFV